MGYYIDLLFDKSKNASSKEGIINEFCKLGLLQTHTFDLMCLSKEGKFCFTLSVYDKRVDAKLGCFKAECRFSWATKSDIYQNSLEFLFDISRKMNFVIYDGQRKVYFDETNIKLASLIFKRTQSVITGMLGTVKDE